MSAAALIVFQILSLIGSVLTAAKLFQTGLYRKYHFFFLYFLFRIPNTVWPLFTDSESKLYFFFWVATEPVTWFFHAIVVLELYRLVLERHKGLYTLGRWAMFAGVGASVTISLISLIPRLTLPMTQQSKTMFWYLAMERGFMLGLAIFLLFMMGFLVLYTVPISRNVKMHARVYTIFFVSNYLSFLLRSLFGYQVAPLTSGISQFVSMVCVFAWFFLLSPKGEEVKTSTPVIGPEQERRVLQHLDALNATLVKASRN
jgi:hypothetical protein